LNIFLNRSHEIDLETPSFQIITELTQHVLCGFVDFEGSAICGCEFVVISPKSRLYAVVIAVTTVVVFFRRRCRCGL